MSNLGEGIREKAEINTTSLFDILEIVLLEEIWFRKIGY